MMTYKKKIAKLQADADIATDEIRQYSAKLDAAIYKKEKSKSAIAFLQKCCRSEFLGMEGNDLQDRELSDMVYHRLTEVYIALLDKMRKR